MADTITAKFPQGIAGAPGADGLTEIERTVPSDEPPPLPTNDKLKTIGKPTTRIDGRLKVTGAAKYTTDVRLPGMLFARMVRSSQAHARILAIDTSAAERAEGVRAVALVDHLIGGATVREAGKETPSTFPVVRYVGQPLGAVAATTPALADEAVRLIRVNYEPMPMVVDVEEARKPDAPLVFPAPADSQGSAGGGGGPSGVPQTGNVRGPNRTGPGADGKPTGDVERALAEADAVVDASYSTQVQTHSAMEPHGVVADWNGDSLTVYASTQGTSSVRDELAEVLGLPKGKIRVVTEFMGGGFGAKFGAGNYGVLAARLSQKAKAPVRLVHDRREEHESGGNRPSSVVRLRIGAKKDGTLTAIHFSSYGTAGTATGAGAGGPAKNLYPCPNVLVEESDVFTNAGPSAAFRAPGHPQGAFCLEQSIDELAEKLAMDPLALRDKIDTQQEGLLADASARRVERRLGAEMVGWSQRHPTGSDTGRIRRGLGVAQAIWYRFVNMDSTCEVRIGKDGSVELLSGVQDIGGGIRTALAQVVAEELGIRVQDVTVRIGDTAYPPGPASGGSVTTGSITPAARNAAYQAKRQVYTQAAGNQAVSVESLMASMPLRAAAAKMRTEQITAQATRGDDYGGFVQGRGRRGMGIGGYGGVQFSEVTVDMDTGRVKVERVVAVHDCGRPINPLAVEGQIHGGIIQGLSYALYENRVLDRKTGVMLNANLETYKIAGAREIPKIEVRLIEEYRARSSTDAGGIGEPSTVATAASIANAVYNATGARIRDLPITPERVLSALTHRAEVKR
jgi:xanthine dehydrogenase YagR molybdenum-binding subunit